MFKPGDLDQLYTNTEEDIDDIMGQGYSPGSIVDIQSISWQKKKPGTGDPGTQIKYKLIDDQLVISNTRVTVLHPDGKVKIWSSTDLQHIPLNSDENTGIIDM
jgi:hypothetical protein